MSALPPQLLSVRLTRVRLLTTSVTLCATAPTAAMRRNAVSLKKLFLQTESSFSLFTSDVHLKLDSHALCRCIARQSSIINRKEEHKLLLACVSFLRFAAVDCFLLWLLKATMERALTVTLRMQDCVDGWTSPTAQPTNGRDSREDSSTAGRPLTTPLARLQVEFNTDTGGLHFSLLCSYKSMKGLCFLLCWNSFFFLLPVECSSKQRVPPVILFLTEVQCVK